MNFTRKYIFITGILFSILILLTSILFIISIKYSSSIVEALSDKIIEQNIITRGRLLIDNMKKEKRKALPAIIKYSSHYRKIDSQLYDLIVYKRTSDDHYFKKLASISGGIVKKPKDISFVGKDAIMQKGMIHPAFDSVPFKKETHVLYSLYHPLHINKKKYLCQIIMINPDAKTLVNLFNTNTSRLKFFMALVIVLIAGGVITLTLSFMSNYENFIKKLTESIKNAVSGSYNTITSHPNDELFEFADSFNKLIEDMKSRDSSDGDEILQLFFKNAVSHLKNKEVTRSKHIFESILSIKPDSFGSLFNLGTIYAKEQHLEVALSYFEKASALNPHHELTKNYINKVKNMMGNVS